MYNKIRIAYKYPFENKKYNCLLWLVIEKLKNFYVASNTVY